MPPKRQLSRITQLRIIADFTRGNNNTIRELSEKYETTKYKIQTIIDYYLKNKQSKIYTMAENSKIQWTDHSVNFWTGCVKVSPGCKFCYMYRDKDRYGQDPTTVVKVADRTVNSTVKKAKPGSKIFTCSWSDFFIEDADVWREWAWDIIRNNPHLIWQILTKRPERIKDCLPPDWGTGWDNVWIGVSVESQKQVDRVHQLIDLSNFPGIKTTFVSVEPLIGPCDFSFNGRKGSDGRLNLLQGVDWVIIGGESGNDVGKWKYRPCDLDWIASIVKQSQESGTPVFVKQMGTYIAKETNMIDRHGGDINEFPESLQIREFPKQQISYEPNNNRGV